MRSAGSPIHWCSASEEKKESTAPSASITVDGIDWPGPTPKNARLTSPLTNVVCTSWYFTTCRGCSSCSAAPSCTHKTRGGVFTFVGRGDSISVASLVSLPRRLGGRVSSREGKAKEANQATNSTTRRATELPMLSTARCPTLCRGSVGRVPKKQSTDTSRNHIGRRNLSWRRHSKGIATAGSSASSRTQHVQLRDYITRGEVYQRGD